MGRNRRHHRDLIKPGRETDPRRQAMSQRPSDLVVASVFEGQHGLAQDTVVGAPEDGAMLRRGRGETAETGFCRTVGGNTAPRAARFGHGSESAATGAANAPVFTGEHAVTGHAQGRQQNPLQGSSQANTHGSHPSPQLFSGQGCPTEFQSVFRVPPWDVMEGDLSGLYSGHACSPSRGRGRDPRSRSGDRLRRSTTSTAGRPFLCR